MNREIKFRAWDKIKKKFSYLQIPRFDGSWDIKFCSTEFNLYTGLKDKNEKEIYEGDIIEAYLPEREGFESEWGNEEVVEKSTTILVSKKVIGEIRMNPRSGVKLLIRKVIKNKPKHKLDKNQQNIELSKYLKIKKEDRVIGNIYENKELLNS